MYPRILAILESAPATCTYKLSARLIALNPTHDFSTPKCFNIQTKRVAWGIIAHAHAPQSRAFNSDQLLLANVDSTLPCVAPEPVFPHHRALVFVIKKLILPQTKKVARGKIVHPHDLQSPASNSLWLLLASVDSP